LKVETLIELARNSNSEMDDFSTRVLFQRLRRNNIPSIIPLIYMCAMLPSVYEAMQVPEGQKSPCH
jgi:hypothetical protein